MRKRKLLYQTFFFCTSFSFFGRNRRQFLDHIYESSYWFFFYDISVYSKVWDEHVDHLRMVFEILDAQCFLVKPSKSVFRAREVEYLGHIISCEDVRVDNRKIEAMQARPKPHSIIELRGFLGLTGYYLKIVHNYGPIAAPLTNLLKKGNFLWTPRDDEAFETLKQAMETSLVLALPDFSTIFVVETEASDFGIGVVLGQNEHPIAFLSKALGPSRRAWSIYAKEMLAILTLSKHGSHIYAIKTCSRIC